MTRKAVTESLAGDGRYLDLKHDRNATARVLADKGSPA
jgi:hypothetical protein